MSVNIKNGDTLTKVASNVTITQANWNDRENTTKNTCIANQPETLTTMEAIDANTNTNALAGAEAVKELRDNINSSLSNNAIKDLASIVSPIGCTIAYLTAIERSGFVMIQGRIITTMTTPFIQNVPYNAITYGNRNIEFIGRDLNNSEQPFCGWFGNSKISFPTLPTEHTCSFTMVFPYELT